MHRLTARTKRPTAHDKKVGRLPVGPAGTLCRLPAIGLQVAS